MAEKDDKEFNIDPDWQPPAGKTDGAPDTKVETKPEQDDPVEALKRQIESEKQARIAAEKQAREAQLSAHKAQTEVADNQLHLINTAIDRVKEQSVSLKAAYATALQAGDFSAVADIQEELADARAKLLQLENGKAHMQSQPKPKEPELVRHSDPVEQYVSGLPPRSAAWIRAHPQYVTDPDLQADLVHAHNKAVVRGIRPETDEYYADVETRLGMRRAPAAEEHEDARSEAARPVRDTAPPAAPPSRGGSTNGRTAKLSADEIEIAELSGMTPEEYARNREALKKEGRYH